ncbi:MAG: agmatinase [bacterium]
MGKLEVNSHKFISRYSFANIHQDKSDFDKAKYVILPVPYDATTTYKTGTREGPLFIINASFNLEDYDIETKQSLSELDIFTLPEVSPLVSSPQDMIKNLSGIYQDLLDNDKVVLMLGGEHSLSIASVESLSKKKVDFSVVQLDAHADLRDMYQGSKYSHACTMRRILEITSNVFQVGIRSISLEEYSLVINNNLPILYIEDTNEEDKCLKKILSQTKDQVYLTIDLDVLDPSIMPAVGNPVAGGMSYSLLLFFIREIIKKKRIVGVDITELCPLEGNGASSALAAQLVLKILMYINKFN